MAQQFVDDNGVTVFIDDNGVILWIDDNGIYLGDLPQGRVASRPGKSFPAIVQGRRIIS